VAELAGAAKLPATGLNRKKLRHKALFQ